MEKTEIKDRLNRLLNNEDFVKVFIQYYCDDRVKELVFLEDVRDENVIHELKAIKSFRDFIEYYK